MREIKFRAWDKSWGIMRYDLTITNEYWSYTKGTFSCGANHETLMRFTGMKDKNGKEIYEGDIVSECVVGQVIWNGDAEILSCPCGVVTQYPTYLNLSQDKKGLVRLLKPKWKLQAGDTYNLFLSKYDGLYTWPKDIEVIGNIYESPELLS
jgi:uncharacterized phage protein (TIGR01671 family)